MHICVACSRIIHTSYFTVVMFANVSLLARKAKISNYTALYQDLGYGTTLIRVAEVMDHRFEGTPNYSN